MMRICLTTFIIFGLLCVNGLPAYLNDDNFSESGENDFPEDVKYLDLVGMTDVDQVRKIQAYLMEKILDRNVNPCDDFFNFVCGNWATVSGVRKKSDMNNYVLLQEMNNKVIYELLAEEVTDKDTEVVRKAKNYYASCLNEKKIKARGVLKPIRGFLKSLGTWPALDKNWSQENFDWLNLTAELNQYGINPIMSWDDNVIKAVYTNDLTKLWDKEIKKTLKMFGVNPSYQRKLYKMVAEFDEQLLDITSIEVVDSESIKLKDLNKKIPNINWEKYLSIVTREKINEESSINVEWLDYFEDLSELMQKTNPETYMNYAFLKILKQILPLASISRWSHKSSCQSSATEMFGSAISLMYTNKYVPKDAQDDLTEIVLNIKAAGKEALQNSTWLDEQSKEFAINKLEANQFLVGYADEVPLEELDNLYKDVHIHVDKYYENKLSLLKNSAKIKDKIGDSFSYTVNAFFDSSNKGKMYLNAGILMPPFYHKLFPQIIKYGCIGMTIGHELMHGFDVNGIKYDADGNINVWYNENLQLTYAVKASCFRTQYKNYKLPNLDLYVDPDRTIGENIADGEGLEMAYRAYKNWVAKNTELVDLEMKHYSALNMTADQLFFLAFAQAECSDDSDYYLQNLVNTDEHTPNLYRIIGSVSNSQSFADAFQCPLGSPMNPTKKCEYLRQ